MTVILFSVVFDVQLRCQTKDVVRPPALPTPPHLTTRGWSWLCRLDTWCGFVLAEMCPFVFSSRLCFREDFTRLKKVVEKKREAAARERELQLEMDAAVKALELDSALVGETMLDEFDTQEQGDVYF